MPHLSVSNKSPIREVVFGRLATLVVYARPFTDLSHSTKIHEYIQLLWRGKLEKYVQIWKQTLSQLQKNRDAQNIISAKSQKVPPPRPKKKLPKQTGQFFLDFVSHAKFLNDQFSAIIIDIVKAYICHFLDRTAHFK